MHINSYETLYTMYVLPVMNYGAGVWGAKDYYKPQVLQNRIQRYYLGVHKFTPLPAMHLEMDWMEMKYERWLEVIRYYNRIAVMNPDRWPVVIHQWDKSLKTKAWASGVKHILEYAGMVPENEEEGENRQINLGKLQTKLMQMNRQHWWV